jgi:hypothetical protein
MKSTPSRSGKWEQGVVQHLVSFIYVRLPSNVYHSALINPLPPASRKDGKDFMKENLKQIRQTQVTVFCFLGL